MPNLTVVIPTRNEEQNVACLERMASNEWHTGRGPAGGLHQDACVGGERVGKPSYLSFATRVFQVTGPTMPDRDD